MVPNNNACFDCLFLRNCQSIPLLGAKMRLNNTRIDKITMIAGPVGNFGTDVLQIVPPMADIMPKNPANIHMVPSLFVHCLAPTAGAMRRELIKIAPTD